MRLTTMFMAADLDQKKSTTTAFRKVYLKKKKASKGSCLLRSPHLPRLKLGKSLERFFMYFLSFNSTFW